LWSQPFPREIRKGLGLGANPASYCSRSALAFQLFGRIDDRGGYLVVRLQGQECGTPCVARPAAADGLWCRNGMILAELADDHQIHWLVVDQLNGVNATNARRNGHVFDRSLAAGLQRYWSTSVRLPKPFSVTEENAIVARRMFFGVIAVPTT